MIRRTDAELCQLRVRHARRILASSIVKPIARARGYRSIETRAELKRLGFTDAQCQVPALLLPVWGVNREIVNYQIRPDQPRIKDGKSLKYELPAKSQMALDIHPYIHQYLGNPAVPLWITEGIFKADAAISHTLCCIAVLGVWNWRGTNEFGGKTALADWETIALNGRQVFIAFDSDVMLKPHVHAALARLGPFLTSRGANVHYVYLPSGAGGAKVGLDDYFAAGHTVVDLLALATTELHRPLHEDADSNLPYLTTEAGMIWRKPTQDGALDVLLANFSASIIKDIVEDDGAEERRRFVIAATVRRRVQQIEIPAQQFAGMSWVGEQLGAAAVLEPGLGTKERVRHAIQTLSGEISEHRVYAHTGWRRINGLWVFLHGHGAIGPEGSIRDVEVGLRGPLSRLALPDPSEGHARLDALSAVLQLLELLPPEIAYPLLGATWLAPLRALLGHDAPDFVAWLHGPSGSFKSELLALAQGFYGDFSRSTLPVNFSATANALERFLFEAKDALLAVDDFHPAGDLREQQAMNQVANRILRGAGNLAGRARMRADTTLRPALDPRCLAIASGERLPEGHSSIARMMPIAVPPGAIDKASLTQAQDNRHHYPFALASYLQSLAQRFDMLQAMLPQQFRALRAELQVTGSHRREPGQLAHLMLGLETFLGFAADCGAMTESDVDAHLRQAQESLLGHAREHTLAQTEEAPAQLFLRYLTDGFAGKRIYLEDKQGETPIDAEVWGWERSAQGDSFGMPQEGWRHGSAAQLVGVLDDDWLLLYPEQVYQFVVGAARAAGRTFPVDQNSLMRRLDEAGLIATEFEGSERRRKVNVWIGGATKRVLKLRRSAVIPASSSVENREDREGREERDDLAQSCGALEPSPSQSSGNGPEPGKVLPADNAATTPVLPGLPGLPGFHHEEDSVEREEMVEWRE
jgi:hypothetical protein